MPKRGRPEFSSLLLKKAQPVITPYVRNDLKERIIKNWKGCEESDVNLPYIILVAGRVYCKSDYECTKEERNLFLVFFEYECSVMITHDGYHHISTPDRPLSLREREYIRLLCEEILESEKDWVAEQKRFLQGMPWREVEGMTVDETIAKFTELGF